jgi:hypothetical protein
MCTFFIMLKNFIFHCSAIKPSSVSKCIKVSIIWLLLNHNYIIIENLKIFITKKLKSMVQKENIKSFKIIFTNFLIYNRNRNLSERF